MRLPLLVSVLVLVAPLSAFAEDDPLYSCKPRQTQVEITMKPEIELKDLLTWAVGFTCKKFVYDPRIVSTGKKVTLMAPGKQTPREAYDMFITALATMNYVVVAKGKLLHIVEAQTGKTQPLPFVKAIPSGQQLVRHVIRPEHASAETLKAAFGAVKSEAGDIQTIGTLLLVTDHADNVSDMVSIAKLVDVPGNIDALYTIPVRNADAKKLSDQITTLLATSAGGKGDPAKGDVPAKLVVDERTNTLIVSASEPAFQRVKALVDRLDISLDIEGGNSMHVYQLGSAVAEELAKTLTEAIQAQTTGQGAKAGTREQLGSLEGQVRVIPDKPTNKLIVMSSGRDFLAIREVIKELDVPRRQVYIEAMILEVQLGAGRELGTSSHGGYSFDGDNSVLVGGVQAPNLRTTSLSSLTTASGLIGGIIGKSLEHSQSLLGTTIPSYAVLFQALADNARTNILSTMPIIVVDNELAKYRVGTNVPFKKGVLPTTPASATSALSTNIERKDLLLELEIKPHISVDDSILLEVKQSSEDLGEPDAELGPSWSTRSVETRVLVRDQQTIVIGGLLQERETASETKVPVLGDIPLLGYLFKYESRSKRKLNLLIMLTPYIIKDHLDLEAIRARKQREYDEFVGAFRTLDGAQYRPRIDYRRKRGLVEEIHRSVVELQTPAAKPADPVFVSPGRIETERSER